jgi:hypothetical protein
MAAPAGTNTSTVAESVWRFFYMSSSSIQGQKGEEHFFIELKSRDLNPRSLIDTMPSSLHYPTQPKACTDGMGWVLEEANTWKEEYHIRHKKAYVDRKEGQSSKIFYMSMSTNRKEQKLEIQCIKAIKPGQTNGLDRSNVGTKHV